MLRNLRHYLSDLYQAHGTFYRLVWTGVQLGSGAAVVAFGADPQVGALVTVLAVILTSEARKALKSTTP